MAERNGHLGKAEGDASLAPRGVASETLEDVKQKPRKRWIFWLFLKGLFIGSFSFIFVVTAVSLLALMGRSVVLPGIVGNYVERSINQELERESVTFGNLSIGLLDDAYRPTIDVENVVLRDEKQRELLTLPKLQAKLDTSELLQGRIALEALEIDGAEIFLERDETGRIRLSFGAAFGGAAQGGSLKDVLEAVDRAFSSGIFRELEDITARKVGMTLTDLRDGTSLKIEDGTLQIVNLPYVVIGTVDLGFSVDDGAQASVNLSVERPKLSPGARVRAKFSNVRARDIASQVGALNLLRILDAPASGALAAEIGREGEVVALAGSLELASGSLQPAQQAKPVPFNSVRTYVNYDRATQRLRLEEITLDAPELRLTGDGHADLTDFEAGIPQTVLGQLRLSNILLDPEGVFENPVEFDQGLFDIRYQIDALHLDIGQMVLASDAHRLVAGGFVAVEEGGWALALDANVDEIEPDKLIGLWPTGSARKLRGWLNDNISAGKLQDASAALRLKPGEKVTSSITFNFKDTKIKFLPDMPAIEDARGHATLNENSFSLFLQDGTAHLGNDHHLHTNDAFMEIPDLSQRPARANFQMKLAGTVRAALELMDRESLVLLKKTGLKSDVARGQAVIDARLSLPLKQGAKIEDIDFGVQARLTDVASDELIEGHRLRVPVLKLSVDKERVAINGSGTLDGVPITAEYRRPTLSPDSAAKIKGRIELSDTSLKAFNVSLPKGSISGKGTAQFDGTLRPNQPADLTLSSNLVGVGLQIEALGWSKARKSKGALKLRVIAKPVPEIRSFSLDTSGLSTTADIVLSAGGGLKRAVLRPLKVGNRFNSEVEVIGQGARKPVRLIVRGGTLDIRKFGISSRSGGGQSASPPMELALDRLIVTDSIQLHNFRGKFQTSRGFDGRFTANLNKGAKIAGSIVPTRSGPSIVISSKDGGGVLRASGILAYGRGGDMSLILLPNGRAGQFNGKLKIKNTRIKEAPALAYLLSAISVVGLLEQLSGEGILFSNVESDFLLTSNSVILKEAFAVGPSMGISMRGQYNIQKSTMNMQGLSLRFMPLTGFSGSCLRRERGRGCSVLITPSRAG